jgi:hypothetical protein
VEDSCAWLHSLQFPQFGHPLLWSLSNIQTWFWMTSHAKVLHLGGAHGFQTIEVIVELVWPKNCIM